MRILLFTDRCLEGERLWRDAEDLCDPLDGLLAIL